MKVMKEPSAAQEQGLDAVVMRCVAKDPTDRYQSASELRAVLEGLQMPAGWTDEDARRFWREVSEGAPARPA